MKKVVYFIISLFLIFSVTACQSTENTREEMIKKSFEDAKSLFKFSARVGFCGKFDAPQGKNMQFY